MPPLLRWHLVATLAAVAPGCHPCCGAILVVSLDGVTALLDDEVALPLGQVLEALHLPLHATAFRLERGLQHQPIKTTELT